MTLKCMPFFLHPPSALQEGEFVFGRIYKYSTFIVSSSSCVLSISYPYFTHNQQQLVEVEVHEGPGDCLRAACSLQLMEGCCPSVYFGFLILLPALCFPSHLAIVTVCLYSSSYFLAASLKTLTHSCCLPSHMDAYNSRD